MTMTQEPPPAVQTAVHRIEVRPRAGRADPRGEDALRAASTLGLERVPTAIHFAAIYLIEGELTEAERQRIAAELLADPVTDTLTIGAAPASSSAVIEVHPLPGVMDPDEESIEQAIRAMIGRPVRVLTGRRYDMEGVSSAEARLIAERLLANTVIHAIHDRPHHPDSLPAGHEYELRLVDVPIRDLDDAELERLSRDAHLFLSLEEMHAIQAEYRRLGREPRDIELETLAQTWSEHCVHKTLKATINYREVGAERSPRIPMRGAGHERHDDGSVTIHNLLKSTVAAATNELIEEGIDWCLSIFVDNAGVIAFDDETAVCFKVETHNHPSAIEPYGGAATGIGGCIRDIIGTGLAAKPIAATDIFCVAHPDRWTRGFTTESAEDAENAEDIGDVGADINPSREGSLQSDRSTSSAISATSAVNLLPSGCLHPRRILSQVVAGVRDYGNRMGIPTLNGAVWFDDDYVGNPLVYCGCVGVMPRDKVTGAPNAGDHIIALGGRTGRDGIHGATFSSAELTDTHADEFSHAVQIGNPVTEKKVLDAILAARDHDRGCLFTAITDCGAGGFSSAVGEMGEALGATVHLERAPLKYAGLSPTEIWISEAQERMVLAVPASNLDSLRELCAWRDVELCDLGTFGTEDRTLRLNYENQEVGRLSMAFLHEGIPSTTREATWTPRRSATDAVSLIADEPATAPSIQEAVVQLLAHPNIASKHWIIRQYDHEVQGATIIKPLAGERGEGPSDAAVIQPSKSSHQGLALANGLATGWRDDPYLMTLAAIDECVRNLVCTGTDPERIAILDNFCWPSCSKPENLGSLVRAAEGCYDGAKAYRTPFISGKDSLNNQFTTEAGETIEIPPTLLISGFGIVPDSERCVTMDAKAAGNLLLLVGATGSAMGGSHYEQLFGRTEDASLPIVDLIEGPRRARAIHEVIRRDLVRSAHDCSEGGLLVAAAEMAIAGGLGLMLDFVLVRNIDEIDLAAQCFAETPSRYLIEVDRARLGEVSTVLGEIPHVVIGEFTEDKTLVIERTDVNIPVSALRDAWRGPLDW